MARSDTGVHTLAASADLTSYQYYWTMLNSSGTVAVATAQTCNLGPLLNKPYTGEGCTIGRCGEIQPAYVGGTVAAGDALMIDTNDGMLIIATNDKVVVAFAMEAGVDGEVISVLVKCPSLCSDVSDLGVANS